jgi:uncharacterized membrane protein
MRLIEKSPWPTLTLIVSLEAIFLSTFVTIGQDRQTAFQQTKADHDHDYDYDYDYERTSASCCKRTRSSRAWSIF